MAKGRKMKSNAPLRAWAAPRLLTKLTCGRWPLPYAAARTQLSGNRVGRGFRAQYGGRWGGFSCIGNIDPPNASTKGGAPPARPRGSATIMTNTSSAMMQRCNASANTSPTIPCNGN